MKKILIILAVILSVILIGWFFYSVSQNNEFQVPPDWQKYETDEVSFTVPPASFHKKCISDLGDFAICYISGKDYLTKRVNVGYFEVLDYGEGENSCGQNFGECTAIGEKNKIAEFKVGRGATAELYTGIIEDEHAVKLMAWENKKKTKIYMLWQTTLSGEVDEVFNPIRETVKFK